MRPRRRRADAGAGNLRVAAGTMILRATHTHFYPGHRGTISGPARIADLRSGGDCLVEFSDGSVTPATLSKSAGGWRLRTGAYRTAAGTDIPEKRWLASLDEDGGRLAFRIRRVDGGRDSRHSFPDPVR